MLKKILGLLAMCFIVYSVPATAVVYTVDHIDDVSIVLNGSSIPAQYQTALGSKTAIRITQSSNYNYLVLPLALAQSIKLNGSQCLAFIQRSQGAHQWLTANLPAGTVVTPVIWSYDVTANQMLNGVPVYIGDVLVNNVSVRQSLIKNFYDSPLSNQFTTCK